MDSKTFKIVVSVVAVLVGLTTLGFVMPWNAASKEDVKLFKEENKQEHTDIASEALEGDRAIYEKVGEVQKDVAKLEGRFDELRQGQKDIIRAIRRRK